MGMSIFVTKGHRRKPDGSRYEYYVLRESVWDRKAKAVKQRYLAYVGVTPRLTQSKARAIAKKLGLSLDELRAVRRLKIVPDEKK
jgi:hypothetical protein